MRELVVALIFTSLVGGGLLFVATFDAEMNQRRFVLSYEKGVYRGTPDPPLSAETREALRARTLYQAADSEAGLSAARLGMGGAGVRPPDREHR